MRKVGLMLLLLVSLTAGAGIANAGDCNAYTYCPNRGVTLTCETWARGCSWYVQPYQYIQCTGLNYWGQWVNVVLSCY